MPILTYEQLQCGVVILNHEGVITYANPFFKKLLQRTSEDVAGQHIEKFLSVMNKFLFHSHFYPQLHVEGVIEEFLLHVERADGVQIPVMVNAQRMTNNAGKIECILMPMSKRIEYERELRHMTKQLEAANEQQATALLALKQLNEQIDQKRQELLTLTHTDALTNIYNRRYIEERLTEQVVRAKSQQHTFSLCIVDIDFFKKVNDTYGHQIGDYVLIEVANILNRCIGARGTVARFGGEEFIVLLPSSAQLEATHIAQRLNEAVRSYLFEYVKRVTISIGIATYRAGDHESNIVNRADRALYYSKEQGRDRTTHFRDIEHVLHP